MVPKEGLPNRSSMASWLVRRCSCAATSINEKNRTRMKSVVLLLRSGRSLNFSERNGVATGSGLRRVIETGNLVRRWGVEGGLV